MNSKTHSIVIRGMGSSVPETRLTNEDLTKIVDTNDEWITARTGIKERRVAGDDLQVSDLAVNASRNALNEAGLRPEDIDLIVVATLTSEMISPATACLVQQKLGCRPIPAFDINAACSGFIYGLEVATAMMEGGNYQHALLIGVEKLTAVTDYEDRGTCILFGDGAGAAVLSRVDEPGFGVLGCRIGADGSNAPLIHIPGGGSAKPATEESVRQREHYLKMNGKEVFKLAVRAMGNAGLSILREQGIDPAELKCLIPHQANIRIIDALSRSLEIPMETIFVNIQKYGNTSAASIPIALDEAKIERNFKRGDPILLVAFGAGLTWAASVIRWY
ncbi:MAG: beta-ketoacyl-ACP synthase III [Puniceicoccaceae bacterium]